MTTKKFSGFLILHWKNMDVRYCKRKPHTLGPYEIPLKLDLDIKMPDLIQPVISGEIEIPAAKAKDIIIENI